MCVNEPNQQVGKFADDARLSMYQFQGRFVSACQNIENNGIPAKFTSHMVLAWDTAAVAIQAHPSPQMTLCSFARHKHKAFVTTVVIGYGTSKKNCHLCSNI